MLMIGAAFTHTPFIHTFQFERNVGRPLSGPDQLITVTSVTTTLIGGLYSTQVCLARSKE